MPLAVIFWVLFLLYAVLGLWLHHAAAGLVLLSLLFVLGWKAFGFIVQG